MSKLSKALQAASVSGAAGLNVEELFAPYVYEGNGTVRSITTNVDSTTDGSLVWIKTRKVSRDNSLYDTVRGAGIKQVSNRPDADQPYFSDELTSFNTTGFTVSSSNFTNALGVDYASWTFKQQPKFFDIIEYTGDGNPSQQIAHNLGSVPGCMMVKCTSAPNHPWAVYHRSLGPTKWIQLDKFDPAYTDSTLWSNTAPTDTHFTVGSSTDVNGTGLTYIVYLFAHNDGDAEFGPTGDQDIIKCGTYTGNNILQDIDLGFEPQWLLVKNTTSNLTTTHWLIIDNMRQWAVDGNVSYLQANLNAVEGGNTFFNLTPTGFQPRSSNVRVNAIGENYIYIAIRRGGTDTPTSASEVFNTLLRTGNGVDTFLDQQILCDAVFTLCRSNTEPKVTSTRLFQNGNGLGLKTSTDVNSTLVGAGFNDWGYNNGWLVDSFYSETNTLNETYVNYAFKRSRGFFDIASYRGDGSSQLTAPHNLGVVPEMMLTKMYYLDSGAGSPSIRFFAYHKDLAATEGLWFDNDIAVRTSQQYWGSTRPTAENFYVGGSADNNINACKYINYLFASVPGVSKVGSYQGNDGTQAIDCGFSNGAQFVILKNITGIGDWVVVDSQRGITSGTDPFLEFNVTVQEQSDDCVSANSLGFNVIQSVSNTNINATGNTYIFYAIAAP